jgi:hypothetical protein
MLGFIAPSAAQITRSTLGMTALLKSRTHHLGLFLSPD